VQKLQAKSSKEQEKYSTIDDELENIYADTFRKHTQETRAARLNRITKVVANAMPDAVPESSQRAPKPTDDTETERIRLKRIKEEEEQRIAREKRAMAEDTSKHNKEDNTTVYPYEKQFIRIAETKIHNLQKSGALSETDSEEIRRSLSSAIEYGGFSWHKYETPLKMDVHTYLVATLRHHPLPDDDSPAPNRGLVGFVSKEINGDNVSYLACRRSKEEGKEASYDYCKDENGNFVHFDTGNKAIETLNHHAVSLVLNSYIKLQKDKNLEKELKYKQERQRDKQLKETDMEVDFTD
jgi:hypothetical protein